MQLYYLVQFLGGALAASSRGRHRTTSSAPPEYSEYVSIYTSLTLVPMNPQYSIPYQPYPDTQAVNQGGPAPITVTNTVFIEAATVTITETVTNYQTSTLLAQCTPQPAYGQPAYGQPAYGQQQPPQPSPPATQSVPAAATHGPKKTPIATDSGSDDSGQQDSDSSALPTTTSDDDDDMPSTPTSVNTSSSIYLPFVTSSKRHRFF